MDRLDYYLSIVPLPVLALAGLAGAFFAVLTPRAWRMPVSIGLLAVWLSVGQLPELGAFQAVAKATGFAGFVLAIAAVALDRNEKGRVPGWVWIYPVAAALTLAWGLNAQERMLYLVRQFQWVLLMVAAIQTARTMSTEAGVLRVLLALSVGLGVASVVTFVSLARNPASISAGLGRFFPWGANPNQIGTVYLLGVPLLVYAALRSPTVLKAVLFGLAGIAALQAILTASRSVNLPLVVLLGIIGIRVLKNPLVLMLSVAAGVMVVSVGGAYFGSTSLDRLATLDTTRTQVFAEYLKAIAASPVFGKLLSGVDSGEEVTAGHAHNAYLEIASSYGVIVAGPMFVMALVTMWATFRVWRSRRELACDPTLITLLAGLMFISYAHGLATTIIYYSTYAWSFAHVVMSCFFLGVWTGGLSMGRGGAEEDAWPGEGCEECAGDAEGEAGVAVAGGEWIER